MDDLRRWEKAPVIGLFAAQGAYVWRWYVGDAATMPAIVVAIAGICAVAAIDGAMVATVMGMRQGRRSRASVAAIVVTAMFGALVALDLYGAVGGISAWLHAGFALTIVCYLLHLAAPMRVSADAVTQAQHAAAQAKALAAQHADDAAQLRQALTQAEQSAAQALEQARQRGEAVTQATAEADAAARRLAQTEQALTRAQAERDAARAEADAISVEIGGKAYTTRQIAAALDVSEPTLRRKLARGGAGVAQAAD